jgi:hypothetical protein
MFKLRRTIAGTAVALCGLLFSAPSALATSATATISAGTFGFINSTPGSVSFSGTLTGVDQTLSTTQAFDVGDATGSGTGWNVTATSTTFTTGSHSLSTSATTVTSAPSIACDASATCTLGTNSTSYPYTLPAASTAPTATKLISIGANTGMGNQTVTPTWKLSVPANTYAGSYTSTWTLSLVSGP